VRERAPAVSATVQHVGLVCLVCSTQVYRVPTTINPGEPLVDGPIVPSADHVEVSLLLSSSGVIDIARACLVRIGFLRSIEIGIEGRVDRRCAQSRSRLGPSVQHVTHPLSA